MWAWCLRTAGLKSISSLGLKSSGLNPNPTAQDFWPDAIASSRVFALGEVWHNALVSEVKRYADATRRGPILGLYELGFRFWR